MNTNLTQARLKKFISYYKPYRHIFVMDLFFAALSSITVLLFPLVSGYITKEVLSGQTKETQRNLMLAGFFLLLLTVIKVCSNIVYGYFGHAMGAKMECSMREELMLHYEKQSFDFHAKNSTGKLMTVISNDLTGMTELFHHGPEDILMTGIKFIGAFVILVGINPLLTLIVFGILPLLCLIAVRTDKIMEKALIENKQDLSELNEHLEDTLSGIRTVKAFGNEAMEAQRFAGKNQKYTDSKCYFYKVEAYFYETMDSYPQFLTMLTVFFGALLLGRGHLDVPVLVTFLLYVSSLAEPVRTILNFMKLYEGGKTGFIRFMDMLEVEPAITEPECAVTLKQPKGEIVFEKVSFCYENSSQYVLENLSFCISSGQKAAFVGASGIGKSTVISLIARFYDATEGTVYLDGTDIKNLSFSSLRDTIGIVQQEVSIFNGTIKDNIRYGNLHAADLEIETAARLAGIHDFICGLEHGYDSMVGTKGIMLSGGQRQRISIARLFLKNPKILILDEATSALDYESEVMIQHSIERLMENRTSIIIAHRLSTIKNADNIFVLADKHIVEQGSHSELLAKNGEYAKLYEFGRL